LGLVECDPKIVHFRYLQGTATAAFVRGGAGANGAARNQALRMPRSKAPRFPCKACRYSSRPMGSISAINLDKGESCGRSRTAETPDNIKIIPL